MPPVAPFLEIAVVWNDPDLQEVTVSASSGLFSGQVNLYAGWKELAELAERMNGFPSRRDDRREFTLGQEGLSGYGVASLTLYCTDSTGHVAFEVAMRTNPVNPGESREFATVIIPAVIGDIDQFAANLRSIDNQVGARAILQNAA